MVDIPGENGEEMIKVEDNVIDEEKEIISAVEVETAVEEQAQEVLEEEKESENVDEDKDSDS